MGTVTTDGSHAKRSAFFSYLPVLEMHGPCQRPSLVQNLHTLEPPTCLGGFFVATVFLLQTERKWYESKNRITRRWRRTPPPPRKKGTPFFSRRSNEKDDRHPIPRGGHITPRSSLLSLTQKKFFHIYLYLEKNTFSAGKVAM